MPHPWVSITNDDGTYYMNKETEETTWDKPDTGGEEIPPYQENAEGNSNKLKEGDPSKWYAVKTSDGDFYYMNKETQETTWEKPALGQPGKEFEIYAREHTVEEEDDEGYDGTAVDEGDDDDGPNNVPTVKDQKWEFDKTKAVKDVGTVGSLAPLKEPRRKLLTRLQSGKWSKQYTESVGAGEDGENEGDAYFVNNVTGETVWDEPSDFVENEDEYRYEGIDFGEEPTLEEGFKLLMLDSDQCKKERDTMLVNGSTDAGAFARLQSLDILMEDAGEDSEWAEKVMENDGKLVKQVCAYLGSKTSADVRCMAVRILVGCCTFDEKCVGVIVDSMGGPQKIWEHVELGMKEAISVGEADGTNQDEEAERAYAKLTTYVSDFVEGHEGAPASEDMINPFFDVMATASEPTFLACCCAVMSLNYHFDDHKKNMVMHVCCSNEKAEFFGEALLFELNEQTYPAKKPKVLRNAIKVVTDLFSDKTTCNYFYTNDLHVLVDIILRELTDLPGDSELRVQFLNALKELLKNSPWFDHGQYRANDISDCLKNYNDQFERDQDSCSEEAHDACGMVLMECGELLETE